jgi:hypothetical protein
VFVVFLIPAIQSKQLHLEIRRVGDSGCEEKTQVVRYLQPVGAGAGDNCGGVGVSGSL